VRDLVAGLSASEAARLAYARGLLYWHRRARYCGSCGAERQSTHGGHARICLNEHCARLVFPRIEPAVLVLVESVSPPGRCLLARHRGAPEGSYSTLAGFVEVGESLEDAVRRKIAEEAGVRVGAVRYQGSQPWPFPAGIMLGFRATALADDIHVDGRELVEARWFTREDLIAWAQNEARGLGRRDSIGRHLLECWLAE
jgi:NAD+ diphosphatase